MASQRVPIPYFVGGTHRLFSHQANPERCVNLFPETIRRGSKAERYLRPTEGLVPFVELDSVDTSAFLYQEGRLFACCGTGFYEIYDNGTWVKRGTIAYDGTKATMSTSGASGTAGLVGHQICVTSGGALYIYDTISHAFTQPAAFSAIVIEMNEFADGYFLALARNRRAIYYSGLYAGTSWTTGTDYLERSWGSDNVSFIKRSGRQLWMVGTQTSEVWADVGNATKPWAPIQGVFLDTGCLARYTGVRDGETLCWLTQHEHGGASLVRANGYQPQQISTYGIDTIVQSIETLGGLNAAEGFVHEHAGHKFYWLQVGGLPTSLVFDFTEQEWHERAMWDYTQGRYTRHTGRSHTYAYEQHYMGVSDSGVIYRMDFDYLTDGLL